MRFRIPPLNSSFLHSHFSSNVLERIHDVQAREDRPIPSCHSLGGREWTMYGLDCDGEMWFRYWKEQGRVKTTGRLKGPWGEWQPLNRDRWT
jgi:hypothetical protein